MVWSTFLLPQVKCYKSRYIRTKCFGGRNKSVGNHKRTNDISKVDIAELKCTQKIGISPRQKKKCQCRQTVDILPK